MRGLHAQHRLPDYAFRAVRVHQHANQFGRGSEATQELEPFVPIVALTKVTPVRLPPGRAKTSMSPTSTGSAPVEKTIGMVEVAALAASADAV